MRSTYFKNFMMSASLAVLSFLLLGMAFTLLSRGFLIEEQRSSMEVNADEVARSAIAFGTIRILEDAGEKRSAIEKLAMKYAPEDSREHRDKYIEKDWSPLCMLEMSIDHLSGKEGKELARRRQKQV